LGGRRAKVVFTLLKAKERKKIRKKRAPQKNSFAGSSDLSLKRERWREKDSVSKKEKKVKGLQ